MTPYAPTLFDAPPTQGTSRKADRQTSRDAAKAKNPSPDQRRCIDALLHAGGRGTIDDVAGWFALIGVDRDRGSLSRRLTDLAVAGLIVDTESTVKGSKGRFVTVWRLR